MSWNLLIASYTPENQCRPLGSYESVRDALDSAFPELVWESRTECALRIDYGFMISMQVRDNGLIENLWTTGGYRHLREFTALCRERGWQIFDAQEGAEVDLDDPYGWYERRERMRFGEPASGDILRTQLHEQVHRVASLLEARHIQFVLAESCTGGLIAATLATVPGISRWLCGSAVVYQDATKSAWLGVPQDLLDGPGAVSAEAAAAMAEGALRRTPQAILAASVTGHLGPDAPADLDGLVYAAVAERRAGGDTGAELTVRIVRSFQLERESDGSRTATDEPLRTRRQVSAACLVLQLVRSVLEAPA